MVTVTIILELSLCENTNEWMIMKSFDLRLERFYQLIGSSIIRVLDETNPFRFSKHLDKFL